MKFTFTNPSPQKSTLLRRIRVYAPTFYLARLKAAILLSCSPHDLVHEGSP